MTPEVRRRAGRLLGGLATLVCIGFLVWLGRERWAELPEVRWTPELAAAVAVALGLYLAGLLLGGVAWYLLLGRARHRLGLLRAVALLLRTNVGKYLPGNVGHLLGRVVLARRMGLAGRPVVASLVFESAVAVVAALVIGAVGLWDDGHFWWTTLRQLRSPGRIAAGAAVLAVAVLGAWLLAGASRREPQDDGGPQRALGPLPLALALVLLVVSFLLYGQMVLVVMESGFGRGEGAASALAQATWSRVTVAFALAWVLGFLTPGSPGGLGVRETVLVLLLAPMTGPARALVLALVLRVLTVVGDGVGFLLSFARRLAPPAETSTEERP